MKPARIVVKQEEVRKEESEAAFAVSREALDPYWSARFIYEDSGRL